MCTFELDREGVEVFAQFVAKVVVINHVFERVVHGGQIAGVDSQAFAVNDQTVDGKEEEEAVEDGQKQKHPKQCLF